MGTFIIIARDAVLFENIFRAHTVAVEHRGEDGGLGGETLFDPLDFGAVGRRAGRGLGGRGTWGIAGGAGASRFAAAPELVGASSLHAGERERLAVIDVVAGLLVREIQPAPQPWLRGRVRLSLLPCLTYLRLRLEPKMSSELVV